MKDTYLHKGQRKKLVEEIRKKGIKDEAVLEAINALPRHYFLEKAFEEWAYQDKAFPIDKRQTISQPYTVARQTELLEVQKREKILEVGTGSGYQAAILSLLGARVYTVERHRKLYKKARELFAQLKIGNIRCYHRDGYKGLPEFAPFDKILVTAAAEEVPEALKQQLKIGGIMVIPVGDAKLQRMLKIVRLSEDKYESRNYEFYRFVPFVKGIAK